MASASNYGCRGIMAKKVGHLQPFCMKKPVSSTTISSSQHKLISFKNNHNNDHYDDDFCVHHHLVSCSVRFFTRYRPGRPTRRKSNTTEMLLIIMMMFFISFSSTSLFVNSQTTSTEIPTTVTVRYGQQLNQTTTPGSTSQSAGVPGHLSSPSALLFDPHVSAQCERHLMNIVVTFDHPFYGIVHVRGYRRTPCQVFGNGTTAVTLIIDLLAPAGRPNYCGVQRVKGSEERSISLVVRLHRALELSDDKHFVISCGNTEFSNRNKNEKLMFKFVDGRGHRITKLYHGEPYRLRAEIISSQDQSVPATNSYHLYVRNCFIFNGNDSDVEFLDADGCPVIDAGTLTPFRQIGENAAEMEIRSMFKIPGTSQLHLQCLVELVDGCRFCPDTLCLRERANTTGNRSLLDSGQQPAMQMLASTTVYVFEPDQQWSQQQQHFPGSILFAGGPGSLGSLGACTEWRFPWLIALCIMLAILLIIMMVVNIFLCTSMSCSCFKPEVIEHEPAIIEDYDPYKIDIGSYYSPYDSRLSLNRSAGGLVVPANNNGHYNYLTATATAATTKPPAISIATTSHSNSYSPSTIDGGGNPATINNNNRSSTMLLINGSRGGGHNHPRKPPSSHHKHRQPSSSKPTKNNNDSSMVYNPYQHSPRSIRSEDFY